MKISILVLEKAVLCNFLSSAKGRIAVVTKSTAALSTNCAHIRLSDCVTGVVAVGLLGASTCEVWAPTFADAVTWCETHENLFDMIYVAVDDPEIISAALGYPGLCYLIAGAERWTLPAKFGMMGFTPRLRIIDKGSITNNPVLETSLPVYRWQRESEEFQYLELVRDILADGKDKPNRSAYLARTLFGKCVRFTLISEEGRRIMPLLTTKWVNYSAVYHELMWFISGAANISYLTKKGVHIWDSDTTNEAITKRGLNYPDGSTGPIYGVQWRHAGARVTYHDDGSYNISGGVDQLAAVIQGLRKDPFSRYHVINSWDAPQIANMVLPPCHYTCIFVVVPNGGRTVLNCMMHMRSTDVGLGLPFNIASYALFTHIIAAMTGHEAGELMITMADCHIYACHELGLREQIGREPVSFPQLVFSERFKSAAPFAAPDDILEFDLSDFQLVDYHHHPKIALRFPEAAKK